MRLRDFFAATLAVLAAAEPAAARVKRVGSSAEALAAPPGTPASGSPVGDGYHPYSDFGKGADPPRSFGIMMPRPGGDPNVAPAGMNAPPPAADPYAAMDAAAAGKRAAVSPADAAANFTTLVQTYLAQNAVDGAWPYKDKDRTLSLEMVSVDADHLADKGEGRFAGAVVLRDVRTRKTLTLEFTADFSGTEWAVTGVKRPAAAKKKPSGK